MFADKYQSIFSHQMEATVYIHTCIHGISFLNLTLLKARENFHFLLIAVIGGFHVTQVSLNITQVKK